MTLPTGWEDDFERLSGYISAALAYTGGTHRLQDVRDGIRSGALQFWPAPSSCLVTEIRIAPSGLKTADVFLAGGNLEEIAPLLSIVEGWAKDVGCVRITATGRKGWERSFVTREAGWSPVLTCFAKEL